MNAKIYNGNVQPNPKEYKIWVNDEGIIKTWNGTEWIEQSGGSGESGGGEDSTVEYLDVSGLNTNIKRAFLEFSFYVKVSVDGNTSIGFGTMTDIRSVPDNIIALGVDTNANIVNSSLTTTVIGYMEMIGMLDMYNSIPRITKEEFYNLEA